MSFSPHDTFLESASQKIIPKVERAETPADLTEDDDIAMRDSTDNTLQSIFLTQEEREEWKDVIKMNDYLTKGRRPQFWEESYVKRVLGKFLFVDGRDLSMDL